VLIEVSIRCSVLDDVGRASWDYAPQKEEKGRMTTVQCYESLVEIFLSAVTVYICVP